MFLIKCLSCIRIFMHSYHCSFNLTSSTPCIRHYITSNLFTPPVVNICLTISGVGSISDFIVYGYRKRGNNYDLIEKLFTLSCYALSGLHTDGHFKNRPIKRHIQRFPHNVYFTIIKLIIN